MKNKYKPKNQTKYIFIYCFLIYRIVRKYTIERMTKRVIENLTVERQGYYQHF